jgi:uncharacterized membrane protein YdfJ with MMPL/SSD domain
MSIVFLSLVTSDISFIQLFAVGLTLAVLMDAFIIRGMLVPAVMTLAGDANWWAPSFLKKTAPSDPTDRYPVDPDFVLRDASELTPSR